MSPQFMCTRRMNLHMVNLKDLLLILCLYLLNKFKRVANHNNFNNRFLKVISSNILILQMVILSNLNRHNRLSTNKFLKVTLSSLKVILSNLNMLSRQRTNKFLKVTLSSLKVILSSLKVILSNLKAIPSINLLTTNPIHSSNTRPNIHLHKLFLSSIHKAVTPKLLILDTSSIPRATLILPKDKQPIQFNSCTPITLYLRIMLSLPIMEVITMGVAIIVSSQVTTEEGIIEKST